MLVIEYHCIFLDCWPCIKASAWLCITSEVATGHLDGQNVVVNFRISTF